MTKEKIRTVEVTPKVVLIVDDEESILHSLERLLRKETYTVLTARGGKEGLLLLEQNPVHVVFSDQRMPDMTGVEFLQKVKQKYPETIRVILSGYAVSDPIVETINQGEVYRFVPKPWDNDELKGIIRQCLNQYDLCREKTTLLRQLQEKNQKLERLSKKLRNTVTEQTQLGHFSQALVARLPIPLFGVSQEGTVILMNEAVGKVFPPLLQVILGTGIEKIFPPEIVKRIAQVLQGEPVPDASPFHFYGRHVQFEIMPLPLKKSHSLSGCVIMVKEVL